MSRRMVRAIVAGGKPCQFRLNFLLCGSNVWSNLPETGTQEHLGIVKHSRALRKTQVGTYMCYGEGEVLVLRAEHFDGRGSKALFVVSIVPCITDSSGCNICDLQGAS